MGRKVALFGVAVIFFLLVPAVFHVVNYSQSVKIENNKVIYDLPYPGILQDSPLYFLKAARDKALDIATRDPVKKAELYLLLSDKRINASTFLAKGGKTQLAITTASKAEKYTLRIPPLLERVKKEGGQYESSFVTRLKTSNAKHKQVITELLREVPLGEQQNLNKVLKLNEEARVAISKL